MDADTVTDDPDDGGLHEAAGTLYGMLPENFTAERDALAAALRAQGRRDLAVAVKALRRPAVAAWLVNALARHRSEEVDRLLALGVTLREAQAGMDAVQLRELGRQRQALVAAIGRQARALARELGRPVSDPVVDAAEGTLRAALADPEAADAVRSGCLARPLSYAGFGPVDVADALGAPGLPAAGRRAAPALPAVQPRVPGEDPEGAAPPKTAEGVAQGVAQEIVEETPEAQEARRRAEVRARREAALRAAALAAEAARAARVRAERAAGLARRNAEATGQRAASARERVDSASARAAELEEVLAAARTAADRARRVWQPLQRDADAAAEAASRAAADVERARQEEAVAVTRLHTAQAPG